jgi:hypothetical protein
MQLSNDLMTSSPVPIPKLNALFNCDRTEDVTAPDTGNEDAVSRTHAVEVESPQARGPDR